MKILAVDDEKLALEALVQAISEADGESTVCAFRSPDQAAEFAGKEKPEIAFLDITMRGMDGIRLAELLMEKDPGIQVIFTTGHEDYMKDAFRIHAGGYVTKPVTSEKIRKELAVAKMRLSGAAAKPGGSADADWKETGQHRTDEDIPRISVEGLEEPGISGSSRLFVRCFGNFQVFLNGESRQLVFPSAKSAELFAYLIDRNGAVCTNAEILSALWEDDEADEHSHMSYFKKIRREMENTLAGCGCQDVLFRVWGGLGVVPEKVSCDYYEYLRRPDVFRLSHTYRGEYMSQYSWAEVTHAALERENHDQ